jgi:hypothetical protein
LETPLPLQPYDKNDIENIFKSYKSGGLGLADGDGHPFCYLIVNSEVMVKGAYHDPKKLWLGSRFTHGTESVTSSIHKSMAYKKSIIPTRRIFQAGLHINGACKLDYQWTNCINSSKILTNGNCYASDSKTNPYSSIQFFVRHDFDEVVYEKDAKRLNSITQAVIYHYSLRENRNFDHTASNDSLVSTNDYTTRFYTNVINNLRKRGLEVIVTLPSEVTSQPVRQVLMSKWVRHSEVYAARDKL